MVKVPGTLNATGAYGLTRSPSELTGAPTSPVAGRGIGSLSVICPVCGTRIYATSQQLGTAIVCPDCIESVVVCPAESKPVVSNDDQTTQGNSDLSAQSNTLLPDRDDADEETAANGTQDDDDSDELTLSEPVTIRKEVLLSKDLLDIQQREQARRDSGPVSSVESGESGTNLPDAANLPAKPSGRRDPNPGQFSIKCPVCDTMIQVTESELGKQVTCPDCYSRVEVRRRRPKQDHDGPVHDEVDSQAGDEFRLSEPADLEVYREVAAKATAVSSFGEQALQDAERRQRERDQGQSTLPKHPLWDGLFVFWKSPDALIRWAGLTVVVIAVGLLTLWSMMYAAKGGAALMMALITTVGTFAVFVFGGAFAVVNCLAILEETANGYDSVREWPEVNIIEWLFESLFMVAALFYSLTPGILLASFLSCAGLPAQLSSLLVGLSLFVLFPIVQLSLLESGSLGTPISLPILQSMGLQWRLWLAFYGVTGGTLIAVLLGGLFFTIGPSFSLSLMILSAGWSFGLLMYYRLLGRLAWACRERGALDAKTTDKQSAGA